jgi:cyclopropane fatty-acyl-phospholipid synthase-like methyltransferase
MALARGKIGFTMPEILATLMEFFHANGLKPGAAILEIGCGSGVM